jgi:predicted adenine nucleotide alpha hydrolase (AANH) superfamily ATPase
MKILLHCCCGPCSIYPVRILQNRDLDLTCLFFNPNIHPYKEFSLRLKTFTQFAESEKLDHHVDSNYGLVDFTRKIVFSENSRCSICYTLRIEETAKFAAEGGFDFFTTTLLYSKYQKHKLIGNICEKFSTQYGVSFFYENFREGWQEGIDSSIAREMYRQPYCGCIYSEQERYDKTLRKKKG